MGEKDDLKKTEKGKRRLWSLQTLWDGLLVAAVFLLVVFTYQWLHREKGSSVLPGDEKEKIRKEIPVEPPARMEAEVSQPGSEPTTDRLTVVFMDNGSEARGTGGETPSQWLSDGGKENLVDAPPFSGNQKTAEGAPGTEHIQEAPEYSDAVPPTVLSMTLDPRKVPAGGQVTIQVYAQDNLSGVQSISGSVKSPSGKAVLPFGLQPSEDGSHFVAGFTVPDRAEMGTWSVASLRLTDNVHNTRQYTDQEAPVSGATFEVIDSDSDSLPPEVVAFKIDPREAYGGENVRITVTARDDKSGVVKVYGAFISPSGNARLSFACMDPGSGDTLSGEMALPKEAESGDWTLNYVRAEDGAKNAKNFFRTEYPSVFEEAVLRVYASGSDAQPPSLQEIRISPREAAYGEKVEILIWASDDLSGISHIMGRVRSPSGKALIPFTGQHTSEDIYRAHIVINPNTEVGEWRVEFVRMVDQARNEIMYQYQSNPFVEEAVFEVTGE